MIEVRNSNKKLVAMIEEATRTVIIVQRGYETRLILSENGKIKVQNSKLPTNYSIK
ncbi:hypothetical protein [Pygmaiobacter massiliensis]|uniref:hypothetical protein n=1 Tax=Pygmaiobacter massiliensis TaxID=1917873 RepID=UPI00289A61CB|nr:hypothetical protein [Pygmaiobacter massiliensis]